MTPNEVRDWTRRAAEAHTLSLLEQRVGVSDTTLRKVITDPAHNAAEETVQRIQHAMSQFPDPRQIPGPNRKKRKRSNGNGSAKKRSAGRFFPVAMRIVMECIEEHVGRLGREELFALTCEVADLLDEEVAR